MRRKDDRLPPMSMREMLTLADLQPAGYPYTDENLVLSFRLEALIDLSAVCVELGIIASERDEDKDTMRNAFQGVVHIHNGDDDSLIVCFPDIPWKV